MSTAENRESLETIQGSLRARELYQYFNPTSRTISSSQPESPDTVLTAHAQHVAIRVNCERAMINFIDRTLVYHVAEATRTLKIGDVGHDNPEDALWLGVSSAY